MPIIIDEFEKEASVYHVVPATRCGCWDVFLLTPEKGSWPLPFLPLQWLVAMETDAQGSRIAGLELPRSSEENQ